MAALEENFAPDRDLDRLAFKPGRSPNQFRTHLADDRGSLQAEKTRVSKTGQRRFLRACTTEGTMNQTRLWITIGACIGLASLASAGTATGKPGLWEITTTTTWQKAPLVQGVDAGKIPGGTHSSEVCLTQEMIDDYGALLPHGNNQCTIQNRVTTDNKTTGEYVCSGQMNGKGDLESTWTDPEHVTGKVHFNGTFVIGGQRQVVEWTTESLSRFKSATCGAVKPHPLPK